MQINKLLMHNFKQYRDVEISFIGGMTGFIGKNGAGKSTIFDAIFLALYGKFSSNKELCKNDMADDKENFSVTLEFEDKGKTYKVTRDFRGKSLAAKAELLENNTLVSTGVSEVNKSINRILKMDSKNFENSFFSKQKDVTSLLAQPVNERQALLRKMLGLSKLDKLESKLKDFISGIKYELRGKVDELLSSERIKQIESEITELSKEKKNFGKKLNDAKEVYNNIEEEYSRIKKHLIDLEKIKDRFDDLVKKNDVIEAKLKGLNENIDKNNYELKTLLEKQKHLDNIIDKKSQYTKLNKEVDHLLEQKSLFEKKNGIKKAVNALESQKNAKDNDLKIKLSNLKDFTGVEDKIKETNAALENEEKILEILDKLKQEIASNLDMITKTITEKKDRIKSIRHLGKESPCPECERPLHEQYDKLLAKYKNEIGDLDNKELSKKDDKQKVDKDIRAVKDKISEFRKQLKIAEKQLSDKDSLEERIDELNVEIGEIEKRLNEEKENLSLIGKIEFDSEILKQKQRERAGLKSVYDEILQLEVLVKKIPELKEEIIANESKKNEMISDIKENQKKLNALNFDRTNYDEMKSEREQKEEKLAESKDVIIKINREVDQLVNTILLRRKDLVKNEELKTKIEKMEQDKIIYEKLFAFIKDFKVKITSRELPAISAEASNLFSNITHGRYLNLRLSEDFNFMVTRDEKEVSLETLSGGEKDLASLCLRIAISKRISALAGRKNMGFLALDEVFGSQDEGRREELLNSLSEISKDFKQIFVISHNQDVQEAFSNKLIITKIGNYSSVSFSNN